MTTIIAAKPTTFKGVDYKSRLEATVAVFLDSLCEANDHTLFGYEQDTDRDGYIIEGLELVPDFRIGRRALRAWSIDFLEVKPSFPAAKYLTRLREAACILGMNGCSTSLLHGSFFKNDEPYVSVFPFTQSQPLSIWCNLCLWQFQGDITAALHDAQNFRWDLYEDSK